LRSLHFLNEDRRAHARDHRRQIPVGKIVGLATGQQVQRPDHPALVAHRNIERGLQAALDQHRRFGKHRPHVVFIAGHIQQALLQHMTRPRPVARGLEAAQRADAFIRRVQALHQAVLWQIQQRGEQLMPEGVRQQGRHHLPLRRAVFCLSQGPRMRRPRRQG